MVYRHFKGGDYEFIALAHVEATLEPVVVYRSLTNGEVFTRPAAEFFGAVRVLPSDGLHPSIVVDNNHFTNRFTPLGRLGEKS